MGWWIRRLPSSWGSAVRQNDAVPDSPAPDALSGLGWPEQAPFDRVLVTAAPAEEPRRLLEQLKPGGVLAATVPRAWPERICWALASGAGGYADQPGGHIRIFNEGALKSELEGLGLAFRGKHYAHGLHAPFWWLKCALWKRRDDHPLVKLYHRFLVWDLMQRPWLTRALDAVVTPLAGKSLALYYRKAPGG